MRYNIGKLFDKYFLCIRFQIQNLYYKCFTNLLQPFTNEGEKKELW